MIAANQTIAVKIVIRSRFFSTTDEPDSVEDTPPPNRSDRPPPLPRCSKISRTSTRLVTTSTMESSVDIRSSSMDQLQTGQDSPPPLPVLPLVQAHSRIEDG